MPFRPRPVALSAESLHSRPADGQLSSMTDLHCVREVCVWWWLQVLQKRLHVVQKRVACRQMRELEHWCACKPFSDKQYQLQFVRCAAP